MTGQVVRSVDSRSQSNGLRWAGYQSKLKDVGNILGKIVAGEATGQQISSIHP